MAKDSFDKMRRRDVLRLIGGGVAAGLVTGCAPKATPVPATAVPPTSAPAQQAPTSAPAQQAPTSAPAQQAPTAVPEPTKPALREGPGASVIPLAASGAFDAKVTFAGQSGPEVDAHARNVSKFNSLVAPMVCTVQEYGRDVWNSTFTTNFQSRSEAWDANHVQSGIFGQAGPAGWLAPLDDLMADSELHNAAEFDLNDWPAAILDLFRIDGKLYALPQEASAFMFFYRSDLVEKYELEAPGDDGFTWTQFIANARAAKEAIKADGKDADLWPTIFSIGMEQISGVFEQSVRSYGGFTYLDNKMPNYNCEEGKAFLADLKTWYDEGLMSPGCTGYGYSEILVAMQQGGGIYMPQWNASAPDLLNPEKSPITAGNMGFSVWPYHEDAGPDVPRSYPSVWSVAVSSFSKQPREAFSYISWFTSKEVAKDYVMNGGGSSGRASLLTDADVLAKNPQFKAMLKGLSLYYPLPDLLSRDYLRKEVLARWLHSAMVGEYGTDEALDKATEEAIQYLKEQGEI